MGRRLRLMREWHLLVSRFAPHTPESPSIWRYSHPLRKEYPRQGWKIHVSGTPLNASQILRNILPILVGEIVFKIPRSLDELMKINSGICYGYSQIGKFITVYPKDESEFTKLAARLDEATKIFESPDVPFDFHYAPRSCVHFRYGQFWMLSSDDSKSPILTAPDGTNEPDNRLLPEYVPSWSANPLKTSARTRPLTNGLFPDRYCILKSIVQRGKGGIYTAMDMSNGEKVVIKEGRASGEMDWNGCDGRDRIRNELTALTELRRARVPVPKIWADFQNDHNMYLVLEKLQGVTVQALIDEHLSDLTVEECLRVGMNTARIIARIHKAGWVWRDCKPANLLIMPSGSVRAIDFEGARRVDHPSTLPWASKGFAPPETGSGKMRASNLPEDLFALGVTLHFLFTGSLPDRTGKQARSVGVPRRLEKMIMRLLERRPEHRPSAAKVVSELSSCLCELQRA
jgi:tRNA A-37 threonylcarbamoyl transferase component Bud32